VSTLAVDTWRAANIWMKSVTDVPNRFFFSNSCTTYEINQNLNTKFKKV